MPSACPSALPTNSAVRGAKPSCTSKVAGSASTGRSSSALSQGRPGAAGRAARWRGGSGSPRGDPAAEQAGRVPTARRRRRAVRLAMPGHALAEDPAAIAPLKRHLLRQQLVLPLEQAASGLVVCSQQREVIRLLGDNRRAPEEEYVVQVSGTASGDAWRGWPKVSSIAGWPCLVRRPAGRASSTCAWFSRARGPAISTGCARPSGCSCRATGVSAWGACRWASCPLASGACSASMNASEPAIRHAATCAAGPCDPR